MSLTVSIKIIVNTLSLPTFFTITFLFPSNLPHELILRVYIGYLIMYFFDSWGCFKILSRFRNIYFNVFWDTFFLQHRLSNWEKFSIANNKILSLLVFHREFLFFCNLREIVVCFPFSKQIKSEQTKLSHRDCVLKSFELFTRMIQNKKEVITMNNWTLEFLTSLSKWFSHLRLKLLQEVKAVSCFKKRFNPGVFFIKKGERV